ncbi:MAG TPA: hypothetical protein VGL27_10820 [Negativicutes bacterium]
MNKLITLCICLLFSLSSLCLANPAAAPGTANNQPLAQHKKIVGIFFEAPATYATNETVQSMVIGNANFFFPSRRFSLIPLDTTNMAIKEYRTKNHLSNVYSPPPLDRVAIQKMAKELNCDYAFFITVTKGLPGMSAGFSSATYSSSIICDIKLLNVETGNYVISKQMVRDGSSDTIRAGIPVYESAYFNALETAMKELTLDTSML